MHVDRCVLCTQSGGNVSISCLSSKCSEVAEVGRTLKFFDVCSHYSDPKL